MGARTLTGDGDRAATTPEAGDNLLDEFERGDDVGESEVGSQDGSGGGREKAEDSESVLSMASSSDETLVNRLLPGRRVETNGPE